MKPNVQTSNFPSFIFVVAVIGSATLIVWVDSMLLRLLVSVLLGLLLVGALEAVHQATHGNLFSADWANKWVGTGLALVLLLNFVRYRAFHAYHHAHTATRNDPERSLYLREGAGSLGSLILAPWGFLNFAFIVQSSRYVAPRLRGAAARNSVLLLGFIALVGVLSFWNPVLMLFLYWGPLVLFTWFDHLLNQAEHYGMVELQAGEDTGDVTNNLLLPKLFSMLFLYRNFHRVHHLEPKTLWHRSEIVYRQQGHPGMYFWAFFRRYLTEGPRLWGVR